MPTEEQWFRLFTKWLSPVFAFIADFLKQLYLIGEEWIKNLWSVLKVFWKDVKSPKRSRALASVVALGVVLYIWFYVPLRDGYSWTMLQWKILTLAHTNWKQSDEPTTMKSIQDFTDAYSMAYGRDCEWFRIHGAVDLLMWREYHRLRNSAYSCTAFLNYPHTKLFPLNVGVPVKDREVITVDALLGRVDYDESGARRYTSIQTSLWKLVNEKEWRLNSMADKQKYNF